MADYITLREAAKLSGYHQDYLSQLIRSGKLSGRRIGKEWLTTKYSLVKYLEQRQKNPVISDRLRLSWRRRHPRLAFVMAALFIVALLLFITTQYQLTSRSTNDDHAIGNGSEVQRVVFANDQGTTTQEVTVTTYTVDDDGGVEISVSAKQNDSQRTTKDQ